MEYLDQQISSRLFHLISFTLGWKVLLLHDVEINMEFY